MARKNQTKYVMLGLLNFKPMTGYELKKVIEQSIGFFWYESNGNIYPVLKNLEKEGFIRKETVIQDGKPNKNIFWITKEGRVEFQKWLPEAPTQMNVKNELLLKVFFGGYTDPETTIGHLLKIKEEMLEVSEVLKAIDKAHQELEKPYYQNPDIFYPHLTLLCGMKFQETMLEWIDESVEMIRNNKYLTKNTEKEQ